MRRSIRALVFLSWVLAIPATSVYGAESRPAASPIASANPLVGAVVAALEQSDWPAADGLALGLTDPLAAKLLFWLRVVRSDAPVDAAAVDAFVTANPDWPLATVLRRRAEEALPEAQSPASIVSLFDRRPPLTPYGQFRLAVALQALGRHQRANEVARTAWRRGDDFAPEVESAFGRAFSPALTADDHRRRLDALLWSGRFASARRLYGVIDPGHRALAEARIGLRLQRGNVDAAVAAVPATLANDPGLIYERVRWRRRNGLEMEARALLAGVRGDPDRPDLWWIERQALARDALRLGDVSQAYRLVRDHAVVGAADYAEAEWLAGWIALRFLREPRMALAHFTAMHKAVRYPISVARAAHWAARASEAAGDAASARTWDESAAALPTTFYGRLSARRLAETGLSLPEDAQADVQEQRSFAAHELVRAVRLLAALDRLDDVRTFVRAVAEISPSPGWQALTTALAAEAGGSGLGVATAKRAMRDGHAHFAQAYPMIVLPAPANDTRPPLEPALVLALIRQESEFDPAAISPAGARGLMQLMPATARQVARTLDLDYSLGRLTSDAYYNLTLGRAYLKTLLEDFDDSYVLAVAAYNAGPRRVRQWLEEYGDPRTGEVDVIDWIEMLPFEETRNYVQRAIENMWIYRARLGDDSRLAATGL